MTWTNVKWIYWREIRDQLRDRRMLFMIFVLPVLLYPLLGMAYLQVAQFRRDHPTSILLLGTKGLPDQPRLIDGRQFARPFCSVEESSLFQLEVVPDLPATAGQSLRDYAEQAMRLKRYDAVVSFPGDFAAQLAELAKAVPVAAAGEETEKSESVTTPEPLIFINTASDKSLIARDRIESVLFRWRQSIVQVNLRNNNVPVQAVEPFQVVNRDIAREQSRRAVIWAKILPFAVLIWALTGAFYPAVDLCAGEKERGTLETLLCSPAQRIEIVWGKLLTIMSFSITTSVLNLVSMGLTGTFVITQLQRASGTAENMVLGAPPISAFVWLLLALLPLSALFSALSLAIAAFARSSKEGQYYLMPLLMVMLPLMMLTMSPNLQLDLGTSIIPVAGVMLLLRSLIEGQYLESLRFALPVVGITVVCCLMAMRWAVDQFNNETVLFRESERWGVGLWLRQLVRDRSDTPSVTEAVFCGVLLLVIRFFTAFLFDMPTSWSGFATTTAVSLIAFFAAPALIMAVILTRSPRKTLMLRWPSAAAIPMAMLLAVVVHPLGLTFGEWVKSLYPLSPEARTQVGAISELILQAPSIWAVLLVMAVTPAICEELAFRGFILSGLRHTGHKWRAIAISALFFGAAHGILQQSLATAVLGLVLGYLVVQTGSLLIGIVFHLLYNAASLLMLFYADAAANQPGLRFLFRQDSDGPLYQPHIVLLSAVMTGAILFWFRQLPCESTREEKLQQALNEEYSAGGTESGERSGVLVNAGN